MDQRRSGSTDQSPLDPRERALALTLVRNAVEGFVRTGDSPELPSGNSLALRQAAAFVTITIKSTLRGCIGLLEPGPLDRILVHCAIAAASEDGRFQPVTSTELPDIRYEISVLSPLRRAESPEEVEVGRHGVFLRARGAQGLLLPQVAMEHGWDRETFLKQVCRKAGLPAGAWEWPDCSLWIFEAEVFGDDPHREQKGRTRKRSAP